MDDVVADITVKALQEMDTGEMAEDKPASRPGSARPPSAKGSPAGSKSGSRPPSAAAERSKTPSVKGSRPGSAAGSKAGSVRGSRPGSAAGQQPVQSPKGSRPASRASAEEGLMVSGSRPGSARQQPAETTPERPASGRTYSARQSPAGSTGRPASGRPANGRPASGSVGRPASGRPASGRPTSGRPASGRPGSGRPASGAGRPASATGRPESDAGLQPPEQQDTDGQWASDQGADRADTPGDQDDQPPQTTDLLASQPPMDGGDGGGDDEDDDFDEDEDELEDDGGESDDESDEGEGEMVVLDPDHPLMKRFQKALKDHLDKQSEKVTLELRELLEATKNKKQQREDVGVELYGVQQELARHQMMLEKKHDEFSTTKNDRTQMETQLGEVRGLYSATQSEVNDQRRKGSELQQEVENLALRLFYMDNAKEDVRSDIAVMKRAAEKAESEVTKAEQDKQRQDLFVDRLVERVDKLREEMAMYEAQLSAQLEETRVAREALTEAYMEIENINLEKKQLFQQWNSSLIGMRRRDEAHSAMQEALNQQQQRILSLETEIEGYKKSISKEQEQNEKLTMIFAKTDADINLVKKLLAQCQAKQDALKNEYATYTRMLHETEQALNRANTDKTLRMNEVNALRKQIEREYLEKVELEDMILEKLRTQLTMDKASQYTDKLTKKMRHLTKDLDTQMAQVENEISKTTLEVSHTKTRSERLTKIFNDLDEEIQQKNSIINRSEAENVKRNAIIERKQGVIDQYNKKLELMISQAGGVELGPLEITINSLQKSIEAEQQDITELQQMWLRDQSELVRLSKDMDEQSTDVTNLKKQLTILSQKKLRIEGDIEHQRGETSTIERSIRNMQNDMLKLNMLLHKERGVEHHLQQSNVLMEGDFVGSLREAEMESIQMQESLESVKEEKERLLNSLVEAERQIMLWEKKTQLARETRAAVDSEVGQGEMRAMKAEIHRMQVRYTQLMKQQERMIQEMEKSVSRRDTIVTRGDAQSKMNKKVLTKGTFQRQMVELKKKIKQTIQEANSCDQEIRMLREHQQELGAQIEEKQLNVQQLQGNADTLEGDVERLVEHKQKNMADLLAKQQRSKYYQQAKDGRYNRLCKTESALETEQQKQVERMQTLIAIVERLNQDYPHAQPALHRASVVYGSRAVTSGDEY